jgi:GNAT superfamily N-acetyltransferase
MHEDRPIGFIFPLPDVLQATAGRHINTAIVKTLAVLPQRRFAGLGSHLLAANRRAARGLGYRRLIHALMHESNKSRSISARYASVFRHYTLFAKQL